MEDPNDEGNKDELQSPRAMAEAAVAEAMVERDRREGLVISTTEDDARQSKTDKNASMEGDATSKKNESVNLALPNGDEESNARDASLQDENEVEKALEDAWKKPNDDDADKAEWSCDKAVKTTIQLLSSTVEELIQSGVEAFNELESKSRDLEQSVETVETTSHELERLKASEEQSRTTITNLLRAVEASKSDTRDMSRVASVEARLRKDISNLRSERDEALAEASESKRKSVFLQEEVRMVKAKLGRVTQEKIKLERDSRTAMSLARSLDSHVSSDTDFYKRKVGELNDQLQAQQALVTEQKHQIDEMRRKMERSMSQNRLAHIRAEAGRGKKRSL